MTTSQPSALLFTQATEASIAKRVRALRKAHGWTLADVEARSKGHLKAVVLGSYERGDRSMSIERAIEIANVFGVPLAELIAEPTHYNTAITTDLQTHAVVIDLRKAATTSYEGNDSSEPFSLFLAWIIGLRQDWNGEVLSLRNSDLAILSLMMFKSPDSVLDWLEKYGLLIRTRR